MPYAYDRYGRPTQDGELTYGYDVNGNRTTIGYPGGVTATYGYDFADRPSSLAVTNPPNPAQTVVSAVSYKPFGPLKGLTLGNGLVETRSFDQRYSPTGITAGSLLNWTYTTDGEGNPTAITDLLNAANSRTFAYQPDQYFLTCAAGPWSPPGASCTGSPAGQPLLWTYDRIGNRLSETRAGATDAYSYLQNTCPMPPDPDRPCPGDTAILDQVLLGGGGSRQYTFGPAGHLTQVDAGANQIVFSNDAEGRLSRLTRPAAAERVDLAYDGRSFLRQSAAPSTIFRDGFETGDLGCWSSSSEGGTGGGGPGCLAAAPAPRNRAHLQLRGPALLPPQAPVLGRSRHLRPCLHLRRPPGGPAQNRRRHLHLDLPDHRPPRHPGPRLQLRRRPPLERRLRALRRRLAGRQPAGAQERGIFLRLPGQWDDDTWQQAALGAGVYYNLHRWYQTGIGRYMRSDPLGVMEDLALYRYADSNPIHWSDPDALRILVCSRRAFASAEKPGGRGNHAYFWDDRPATPQGQRACGRGSGGPNRHERGPGPGMGADGDQCNVVPGSEGREDQIMQCCAVMSDTLFYFPILDDCQTTVSRCLRIYGLTHPGVPGGRFGRPCDQCPAPPDLNPCPAGVGVRTRGLLPAACREKTS